MITRRTLSIMIAIAVVIAAGALISRANKSAPAPIAAADPQQVLYWYDPMHPEQHFDKPGKSPFMDMQLVPRYGQEPASAQAPAQSQQLTQSITSAKLTIDARSLQKLGVRLAPVQRGALATTASAVGTIVFNERDTTVLQARSAGFVERVYDLAVGDKVARGAPLVDVRVPEWSGVQQELLVLLASGDSALIAAARARSLALGLPAEALAELERSKQARQIFTITAPQAGVIKTLDIRAGMSIAAGAPIATLNGIERVWLEMAVPQTLAQAIAVGAQLEANFSALPGESYGGTIIAVLPESDAATRTLRLRAELKNPRGNLRPGLLAQVRFAAIDTAPVLTIPAAAVISGGVGERVIVANSDGTFMPVLVRVGRADRERVEILQGISEGQQVVISGQFLIDSEANLTGQLQRLENTAPQPHSAEQQP